MDRLVTLGRFGRPHGIHGEIRLWAHNPASPVLAGGGEILVGPDAARTRPMRLLSVRQDGRGFVARVDGVTDRDSASALTGLGWYVPREALPPPEADEVYVVDLIGLRVRTEDGAPVGVLEDVVAAGGGEVLVIRGDGREHLVPNVEQFVVRMDLEAGEIVIRPIEGLLDE